MLYGEECHLVGGEEVPVGVYGFVCVFVCCPGVVFGEFGLGVFAGFGEGALGEGDHQACL